MTAHDQRPTGVELAYDRIRSAIVEGGYGPGDRLVESRVADEIGLSRTPVREAIRRLDAEGLVVATRNRGAIVRQLSVADVIDLYELRARLESYAAELAAERMSDDELVELRRCVVAFSAVVSTPVRTVDEVSRLSAANGDVHRCIVDGSHHDRLASMLARTVDIPLVFRAFRAFGEAELQRSDLFHRLILAAIEQRDGERAARLIREHVRQGLDAVIASMTPHGSSTDQAGSPARDAWCGVADNV